MDWNEAIALVHGSDWKHAKIGLTRMKDLLKLLGNPQKDMKYIHIAGTNGKGSASIMSQSILTKAGYRTGRYISPHIDTFNERMSIDGELISDEELREEAKRIKEAIRQMNEEPTDFEIITAMAFDWFHRKHCDLVVLEVGMGGRLDATNVITSPLCSVIMHIGLDHTEFLGNTVQEIAREKAGIIKAHCPVIVYDQAEDVLDVIRKYAYNIQADMHVTAPDLCEMETASLHEQIFSYRSHLHIRLNMPGRYQIRNACVVLDLMDLLRTHGFPVSETAIREGLQDVRWPGRYELMQDDPAVILDGAHNPNGVEALVDSLQASFPKRKIIFVVGVMRDKDIHDMILKTAPYAKEFIAEVPISGYDRTLQIDALMKEIRSCFSGPVTPADSVNEGLTVALAHAERSDVIVCFGSLYQVAAVRKRFYSSPA